MIVTVTLNPAVDEEYILSNFSFGGWTRAKSSERSPGGKGINVATILNQLGHETAAMGYLAGFNGDYIRDSLRRDKITTNFVHVSGETRTNVYIVDEIGEIETGITEKGTHISEDAQRLFLTNYKRMINRASAVVIGGSLPPGVNLDIYRDLVSMAKSAGLPVYLDAEGPAFFAGVDAGPFFAKIDHRFVSTLSGSQGNSLDDMISTLSDMRDLGVQWAVSSYHIFGDLFSTPLGTYLAYIEQRDEVVSLISSSDSLVAGLVAGIKEGKNIEDTIRFCMACAMESSTHLSKGITSRESLDDFIPRVIIEKMD